MRWLMAPLAALCIAGCGTTTVKTSGPLQATITVGGRAGTPAPGAGAVWIPNTGEGTVSKIDPATNRVSATIRIGDAEAFYHNVCEGYGSVHSFMVTTFNVRRCDLPSAVAANGQDVWAAKNDSNEVVQIDPRSNRVSQKVPIGALPFNLLLTRDALWVTSYVDDAIVRVDPASGRVVTTIKVPGNGPTGMVDAGGFMWVANSRAGSLSRIDPQKNTIEQTTPIMCPSTCLAGSEPLAVATTGPAVWVRNVGNGTVARVNARSARVEAMVEVDSFYGRDGQDAMAVTPSALWLSGISLQRVDPASNRVSRVTAEGGVTVAAGFDSLWVTDTVGHILRLDPRRLTPP